MRAFHLAEQRLDLSAGEDSGQAGRAFRPFHPLKIADQLGLEHVAIQEDQGVQRDILRRGGDLTLGRQVRQVRPHLRHP
jgi:hypothetical protein